VASDRVTITVSSEEQKATLKVNESAKFELTGDEYYALKVRVDRIIDSKAVFTINSIHEIVEIAGESAPTVSEAEPEASEEKKTVFNYVANIVRPVIDAIVNSTKAGLIFLKNNLMSRNLTENHTFQGVVVP